MDIKDDVKEADEKVEVAFKNGVTEAKKDVKDAWADTKAAAEKVGNKVEAEVNKR